jgi:hypothetical protein
MRMQGRRRRRDKVRYPVLQGWCLAHQEKINKMAKVESQDVIEEVPALEVRIQGDGD